jgi:hypothetical protein
LVPKKRATASTRKLLGALAEDRSDEEADEGEGDLETDGDGELDGV